MRFVLIAVGFGLLSAPLAAQGLRAPFEFRGHHFGEMLPDSSTFDDCEDGPVPGERTCNESSVQIGDATVSIDYSYLHGKLYYMYLTFPRDDFEPLEEVLRARFGAAVKKTAPFATVGGIHTTNTILTWSFAEGNLEVRRYGASIREGYGVIGTASGLREFTKLMEEKARVAAARDLAPPEKRAVSERVDTDQPYFEFQVEKPVSTAPDSPQPRFPEMLKSANIEGEVLAQFVIDTTGHYEPGSFKVLKSSHDLFTAAVKNALPNMRFSPAEIGGRKVKQLVQQPFTFPLTK